MALDLEQLETDLSTADTKDVLAALKLCYEELSGYAREIEDTFDDSGETMRGGVRPVRRPL